VTLLVPTLKRKKEKIPNFNLKFVPTFVGNNYTLNVGYGSLVENG